VELHRWISLVCQTECPTSVYNSSLCRSVCSSWDLFCSSDAFSLVSKHWIELRTQAQTAKMSYMSILLDPQMAVIVTEFKLMFIHLVCDVGQPMPPFIGVSWCMKKQWGLVSDASCWQQEVHIIAWYNFSIRCSESQNNWVTHITWNDSKKRCAYTSVTSAGCTNVVIGASAKLELVGKFWYLGNVLSVDGDAGALVEARIRIGRKVNKQY